jgi:hypothetical protein
MVIDPPRPIAVKSVLGQRIPVDPVMVIDPPRPIAVKSVLAGLDVDCRGAGHE